LGGPMQRRGSVNTLDAMPEAERALSSQDSTLARLIASNPARWPCRPTEDPIWGLLRIVMAQQISTRLACSLAERLKVAYPGITTLSSSLLPDLRAFRELGLPERRAHCCITILRKSEEISEHLRQGISWDQALTGIKGIGPWTLSVFRIMVLREPDELPIGDVGLQRAISNVYGTSSDVEQLASRWRPFRSVACWYLWRTLGNEQLG
jgi:DNA-3-methyladenine glycosylase II